MSKYIGLVLIQNVNGGFRRGLVDLKNNVDGFRSCGELQSWSCKRNRQERQHEAVHDLAGRSLVW